MYEYKKILVPVDFSAHSLEASRRALDLAQKLGAEVAFLHVIDSRYVEIGMGHVIEDPVEEQERLKKLATERMRDFLKRLHLDPGKARIIIAEGIPHREIVRVAEEERPDLLVIGSHGRSGMQRAILGSQSELVVRHCRVPALVVHATPEELASGD